MSGVIYKIVTGDDVYVGSTFNLYRRRIDHKKHISNKNHPKYGLKLYETIRANGGEWDMTIYKDNLSMTTKELCIYEQEVIDLLGATLNTRRAHRTEEQVKQQARESVIKHRDKNLVKRKAPTKCECGCVVRRNDMARHRKSAKHLRLMTTQA